MPVKKQPQRSFKSDLAKARDAWLQSPEGKQSLEPSILSGSDKVQYLENRLVSAFLAGAKWQKENPSK